jgi:hypothetical protein
VEIVEDHPEILSNSDALDRAGGAESTEQV